MILPRFGFATGEPRFRLFFLCAGLDAIAGAAIWLPIGLFTGPASLGVIPAIDWHKQELLFGAVPACFAGFLLTALPRWTGRPPASPAVARILLVLWLAGRAASLVSQQATALAATVFIFMLALVAAHTVAKAQDRRNVKVVTLLFAFGLGAATIAGAPAAQISPDFGYRLSLAAVVGLIMVVGGRVVPSLTATHLETCGAVPPVLRRTATERAAAATSCVALGAWIIAPDAGLTGTACALAFCGQATRLAQWRGWRTVARPSVLAFHVAYGWVAIGFAFAAFHPFCAPGSVAASAAVHAWTVGAIGQMSLSVMASMIRRRSGRAFTASTPMTLAYVCGWGAPVVRMVPELLAVARLPWLRSAALAWVAAFGLFLVAFRHILLRRGGA